MTQVLSHPVNTGTSYMDRPFGYGFFSENRDEPPPPEPPAAVGRPLLNENETNMNNTLFGNIEDPRLLETLHQFPNDAIPNLFGASSSYGHGHPDLNLNPTLQMFHQQTGYNPGPLSAPAHVMSFSPQLHNPPQVHNTPQPPQQPQPQPQTQTPQMPPHHRTQSSSFIKPMQATQLAMQRKHSGQQRPTAEMIRRASSDYLPTLVGGNLYSHAAKEMLKEGRDNRPDSYMERRMTFTYGSDTGFKGNAYNPPKHVLTHTQNLEANKVQVVHTGYKAPFGRPESANDQEEPQSARSIALESIADESDQEQEASRKRRRADRDDLSEDDDEVLGISRKKSRPQLSMSIPPPSRTPGNGDMTPGTPGGSRKDSDAKPARVNLTEEEKKMNHIRSEQKRRNQIKEGFADLTDLMPENVSAGPSKCTILSKAVDWVQDLIEGNRKLREQLNTLTGSTIQASQ